MVTLRETGYAPVGDLELYYEIHGRREAGAPPLLLVHGGLGRAAMFGDVLIGLAAGRQVIGVDLQGHGHTADIERPLRFEAMGDDLAGLIRHLDVGRADVMGYSLGGGAVLRAAIQHPGVVRRLVLLSTPFSRNGWYPEILAGMEQLSAAAAEAMKPSPMYQAYVSVAPDPGKFPSLLDKLSELLRRDYDWSEEVAALQAPTLLAFGDADSIPPSYAARFYGLLGGGERDAGWDGSGRPTARLAILPGRTHYDIFEAPELVAPVAAFLDRGSE
jgi:pimeloyl-ACP methyl ester carboxylesterase